MSTVYTITIHATRHYYVRRTAQTGHIITLSARSEQALTCVQDMSPDGTDATAYRPSDETLH